MYDIMIYQDNIGIYESDSKHIEDVLIQKIGDNKRTPYIGIGAVYYVNGNDQATLAKEIRRHCQADGVQNLTVSYNNDNKNFEIIGKYK